MSAEQQPTTQNRIIKRARGAEEGAPETVIADNLPRTLGESSPKDPVTGKRVAGDINWLDTSGLLAEPPFVRIAGDAIKSEQKILVEGGVGVYANEGEDVEYVLYVNDVVKPTKRKPRVQTPMRITQQDIKDFGGLGPVPEHKWNVTSR